MNNGKPMAINMLLTDQFVYLVSKGLLITKSLFSPHG